MIHKRTYRIENTDDIIYHKTLIVNIGLDRTKEWELTIKDFGFKVNSNKLTFAKKEIKQLLLKLHQDYIDGTLDEKLRDTYSEYVKPYFLRSQLPQSESDKIRREENRNKKLKESVEAQEIISYGLEVFNNEEDKFYRWLDKPNISLNNKIPKMLLLSDKGRKEIKRLLDIIEYSEYSN